MTDEAVKQLADAIHKLYQGHGQQVELADTERIIRYKLGVNPEILPCPECGAPGDQVKFTNCGYTAFNKAKATCKCGHSISVDGDSAKNTWNAFADSRPKRRFYHYLASRHSKGCYPGRIVERAAEIFRDSQ